MTARLPVQFSLSIKPPPGLTPVTGSIHKFQQRTVNRLNETSKAYGAEAAASLQAVIEENYPAGTGAVARSVKVSYQASRTGVSAIIQAGGVREFQFMSVLGGNFHPEVGWIYAGDKKLKFRATGGKHEGRIITVEKVFHKWRHGEADVIFEEAQTQAAIFQEAAIEAMSSSIVELSTGRTGKRPTSKTISTASARRR